MTRTGLSIEFPAEVHRERDTWVASCPQLHVASQGSSAAEAIAMLREALALFIEGCCEQGILDRVLAESGLETAGREGPQTLKSPQTPL